LIPEPKWLELLKSSGDQAVAVAEASGLYTKRGILNSENEDPNSELD
jgi:hypothetical protein